MNEEQDIEMFQSLNASPTGKFLIDYLERVLAEVCDVRQYGEMDNKTRLMIEKIIREKIINRIKVVEKHKSKNKFQYA